MLNRMLKISIQISSLRTSITTRNDLIFIIILLEQNLEIGMIKIDSSTSWECITWWISKSLVKKEDSSLGLSRGMMSRKLIPRRRWDLELGKALVLSTPSSIFSPPIPFHLKEGRKKPWTWLLQKKQLNKNKVGFSLLYFLYCEFCVLIRA